MDDKYSDNFAKLQSTTIRLFLLSACGTITLMFFNVTFFPRFPMYIYSLVPSGQDICWAKVMSGGFSLLMVTLFVLCEGQIEVFFISFAQSISNCLQILTYPAEQWIGCECLTCNVADNLHDINSGSCAKTSCAKGWKVLEKLDKRLSYYHELSILVKSFNRIFCWPISLYKVLTMLRLCCYVYVLLKHADYSFYGLLIFPYAALSLIIKFGIILMTLGNVPFMSKQFLKYWIRVVVQLERIPFSALERKLARVSKFGFMCGNFYIIRPHTVLTFFSVTLTYVIILLQL